MNMLFGAYQKIIEIALLIGGIIGLYIWIRKDAYDEGQEDLENEAYEEYFRQSEQIRKINNSIERMSDDDVDRMLGEKGWNFQ